MFKHGAIVRCMSAVGLVLSMLAAFAVGGSAQVVNPEKYPAIFTQDVNECYFASVSNGEDFGLGPTQTSVTVQNLSSEAGVVYLKVGKGFAKGQFAALQPGASKSFSAASLGINPGTSAPVVAMAYDWDSSQAGKFTAKDGIAIGCVAKQAAAGNNLPATSSADTAVSGYNATSGREVGFFDDLYLPIVQTNCGPGGCWDTVLRVANVGPFDNAAVTIRFFPADDGSGSLNSGFQVQRSLNQGQLASITLSTLVPQGWVGSAHVYTDDAVVAIADRFKAGTDMWITNTASNAVAESSLQLPSGPTNMPYVLYAPDVRLDYNGWNTGISVANTVDHDNTVNIQYFGSDGNAPQAQTQRLSAHGMSYFYNPSSPTEDACAQPVNQIVTCDFVGGAIVLSQAPVAVAVDGVKYFGNDASVGQAFSYSATGNVFQFQAAPLVQKGSPATGMGATSGITFLNTNGLGTYITAKWINPSGTGADNFGPSVVWVPAYATGFIYTMTQRNLPNGFTGSAYVTSQLPIAATSTNVDYAVSGDGTAIWNLYNPCGYYRAIGDCVFTPEAPALATKNFDVRPLGADVWICVFNAADGQGGKPTAPTDDCRPEWIFDKGAGEGGQGQPRTFVTVGPWYTIDDSEARFVVTRLTTAPPFAPVVITADYNKNTITSSYLPPEGGIAALFTYLTFTEGGIQPGNANLACTDFAGQESGGGEFDPMPVLLTPDGQMSGPEMQLLGDLNNAIFAMAYSEDDDEIYCAQLEEGSLRPETPEEMQERLGTVVPPFQPDANGLASVDLPAGCYFFGVSAEGFTTKYSPRECLTAGATVDNRFDLATPTATPTATTVVEPATVVYLCVVDEDTGAPLPNVDIRFYDEYPTELETLTTNQQGVVTRTMERGGLFDIDIIPPAGSWVEQEINVTPDVRGSACVPGNLGPNEYRFEVSLVQVTVEAGRSSNGPAPQSAGQLQPVAPAPTITPTPFYTPTPSAP